MQLDLQNLGQLATGLGSLLSAGYLLGNRARITIWFKRRDQLIAERNVALEQTRVAIAHATSSAMATADFEKSVAALRLQIDDKEERLQQLEHVRPLYDAFILWVPHVLEYIVWIEKLAKSSHVDLGGREMPPLPRVLGDHFRKRGL